MPRMQEFVTPTRRRTISLASTCQLSWTDDHDLPYGGVDFHPLASMRVLSVKRRDKDWVQIIKDGQVTRDGASEWCSPHGESLTPVAKPLLLLQVDQEEQPTSVRKRLFSEAEPRRPTQRGSTEKEAKLAKAAKLAPAARQASRPRGRPPLSALADYNTAGKEPPLSAARESTAKAAKTAKAEAPARAEAPAQPPVRQTRRSDRLAGDAPCCGALTWSGPVRDAGKLPR